MSYEQAGFARSSRLEARSCSQGAVAQLGERLVCNQEATGSIPVSSTKIPRVEKRVMARTLVKLVEKVRGVPQMRGGCSECGWVSEMRKPIPLRSPAEHRKSIRTEFLEHDCNDFPGGTRRWRFKPT